MLQSNLNNTIYATRYQKIFNPPNPDAMIKYEQVFEYQYTAAADGETIIILSALIGALRIIDIEKEIRPINIANYSFNSNTGQLNLLNGVAMAAGETLFITYALLITS
jgi:hypothetical protein